MYHKNHSKLVSACFEVKSSARKKVNKILKCIIKSKIFLCIFPLQKKFLFHCPVYPLLSNPFLRNKCHRGRKNKNGKY